MYCLLLVHAPGDYRLFPLHDAIPAESNRIGFPIAVGNWNDLSQVSEYCTAVIYLGSTRAASDGECRRQVATALTLHLPIIPVVEGGHPRAEQVDDRLQYLKTITWSTGQALPHDLLETVREVLGITERERRIFISYRQIDAASVAIQLHQSLTARRFRVFLDQFETSPAENIQDRIAEALEDMACVLLLQSPQVHTSEWVDREITQALRSQLPVLILRWSNAIADMPKIREARLPSFVIDVQRDLVQGEIRAEKLTELLNWAERYHADGLLRRRRESIEGATQFAEARGWTVTVEPRWKLALTKAGGGFHPVLLGLTPRLTKTEDLHELDAWPVPDLPAVGVRWRKVVLQTSTELPEKRMVVLHWVAAPRDMGVALGVNALGYFL